MWYGGGRRWWANFGGVDVDVGVPLQGAIVMYYGGGGPTLAEWTWHQGAIAGCHCWLPLLGAIAGCHCSVLWWGETMVGQLWGSGRGTKGAIAGCHCWVPLQGAIVMCYGGGRRWWANFGGVDVAPGCHCRAPLQGAIVVCYGGGRRWREKKSVAWKKLRWTSCRRCTVVYIDNTKMGFCYLGSMLV